MSYCRWSSHYYQEGEYRESDVYVYEDVNGGWTIHVAHRRLAQTPPPDCRREKADFTLSSDHPNSYVAITRRYREWRDSITPEWINLGEINAAYAGESFNVASPGECADLLEDIRKAGLNVPQYAIDALREEQQELDNE